MTWSIAHTIPVTSYADNHTAIQYFFDTYLSGKTAWTVSAHPDASLYKRSTQCTLNNKFGGTYTMYGWVNWVNASPLSWTWYEDATYTTTPGDLGTDATNSLASAFSWPADGTSWQFCTSDQNSQSMLVILNNCPVFYWPGITEGLFFEDDTWDGSTDSRRTHIIPHVGYNYASLSNLNAPVSSGTSGTEQFMIPSVGYTSSSPGTIVPTNTGNWIATNFNWWYSPSTSSMSPGSSSMTAFTNGGHTDCGIFMPGSGWYTGGDTRQPLPVTGGATLLVGSNYWWNPSTDLGRQTMVFDFGTSDPGII